MSNPLHLQIESVATLVAALSPQTSASELFTRVPGDLPMGMEPPVAHRTFDVRFDPAPALTTQWHGTSHRVVVGRFVVEVAYDGRHAHRTLSQLLVEDSDQIVSLCESPSTRVSADVLEIVHVDRRIEQRDAGSDFVTMALTFSCEYRVAL